MKVLYVEDNPANVFLVKRVAKMGQHEIVNYIDGGQALNNFDEINPDLVLMDIQLAGDKSGLDVVRELRERGVKTPIIAVTAYAMVGDKERCLEAGCNDYLPKPLPIPRLVEIFQHYNDRLVTNIEDVQPSPQDADVDATLPVRPYSLFIKEDTSIVKKAPEREKSCQTDKNTANTQTSLTKNMVDSDKVDKSNNDTDAEEAVPSNNGTGSIEENNSS